MRIVQKNFQCILFPALLELIPHDGHNDYTDFGLIIEKKKFEVNNQGYNVRKEE